MQLDLANGKVPLQHLLLIVVDDHLGGVKQVALVGRFLAPDTQLEERDAAEQPERRGIDADAGVEQMGLKLTDDVLSHGLGIGPVQIQPTGGGDNAEDGEDQASDQAFPPEHGSPSGRAERASSPAFRGKARERGG